MFMLHYKLFRKDSHTIKCHNEIFLIVVLIFITNDDVNSENLVLYGPASAILTISTTDMVSQN